MQERNQSIAALCGFLRSGAAMRIKRTLLIGALMLTLGASAWAQAPDRPRPSQPGSLSTSSGTSPSQAGAWKMKRLTEPPLTVESMKMLAPGIGWARSGEGIFWTENGGKNWKRVTIPTSPDVQDGANASGLYDFFFLDAHKGWAMLAGCAVDNPKKLDLELDLLSTIDSGTNWSRTQVTAPTVRDYGNRDGLPIEGCGTNLAFADSLHGWISVTVHGETMNTWWSFLLVTSDGGKTWRQERSAPTLEYATMLLVSPSEGWLLGSSQEDPYQHLYVTRDGARSWHRVSMREPKELSPATETGYELPVFLDSKHGHLRVNYSYYERGNDIGSEVLFATADSGRTWNPDRIVKNVKDGTAFRFNSSTVVDSSWIFAAVSDHHPILTKLGAGERIDGSAYASGGSSYQAAVGLSFVTPSQGWVIVGDGNLLSTTDGGSTWTDITPGT